MLVSSAKTTDARRGQVVPAARRHAADADDERLLRADAHQLVPEQIARERAAARRVDAQDDRLHVVVLLEPRRASGRAAARRCRRPRRGARRRPPSRWRRRPGPARPAREPSDSPAMARRTSDRSSPPPHVAPPPKRTSPRTAPAVLLERLARLVEVARPRRRGRRSFAARAEYGPSSGVRPRPRPARLRGCRRARPRACPRASTSSDARASGLGPSRVNGSSAPLYLPTCRKSTSRPSSSASSLWK